MLYCKSLSSSVIMYSSLPRTDTYDVPSPCLMKVDRLPIQQSSILLIQTENNKCEDERQERIKIVHRT